MTADPLGQAVLLCTHLLAWGLQQNSESSSSQFTPEHCRLLRDRESPCLPLVTIRGRMG